MVQQMNASIKSCASTSSLLDPTTPFVGPWKCNVCEEKFINPKAHVDHMSSHATAYPSSCQLCLSRFPTTDDLLVHICVANARTKARKTSNATSLHQPKSDCRTEPNTIAQDAPAPCVSESNSYPTAASSLHVDNDVEVAQSYYRRRSLSKLMETNNNQNPEMRRTDFFIRDPWQACSALRNEEQSSLLAKEVETSTLPKEPASFEAFLLANPVQCSRRTPQQIRGFSFSKGHRVPSFDSKRTLSMGSSQNSTQSFPTITESSEVMINGPLLEVLPSVDDDTTDNTADSNLDSTNIPRNNILKDQASNISSHYTPGNPSPIVSMNYVNILDDDGFTSNGPFNVKTNHSGGFDITPIRRSASVSSNATGSCPDGETVLIGSVESKASIESEPVESEPVESVEPEPVESVEPEPVKSVEPVADVSNAQPTEQEKDILKITFCRSEGQRYVLKRKSTDSEGVESVGKQSVQETPAESIPSVETTNELSCDKITNESSNIQSPVVDSPRGDDNQNENELSLSAENKETSTEVQPSGAIAEHIDDTFDEAVEAAMEQSRVKRIPTMTPPATSDADLGESSNHADAPKPRKLGFRPRFIRAIKSVRSNIKMMKLANVEQNKAKPPNTEDTPPATVVSTGSEKSPMTSLHVAAVHSVPDIGSPPPSPANKDCDNQYNNGLSTTSNIPGSPNKSSFPNSQDFDKSTSPDNGVIVESESSLSSLNNSTVIDLGNHTSVTNIDRVVPDSEAPNSVQSNCHSPSRPPSAAEERESLEATVTLSIPETSDKSPETENEHADDNDTDRLVIDVPEEGEVSSEIEDNVDRCEPEESCAPETEKALVTAENLGNDKINGDSDVDSNHGVVDDNEDFRCQVCQGMFVSDEELEQHFKESHFRLVATNSGNSDSDNNSPAGVPPRAGNSIFEDDSEEPDPAPAVIRQNHNNVGTHTLSSLLRRNSMEVERPGPLMAGEANIPIRTGVPFSAPQMRPGFSAPDGNASAQRPNMVQQSYLNHPAAARAQGRLLYPGMVAPGQAPLQRMPVQNQQNGYPTTLHQALVNPLLSPGNRPSPPRLHPRSVAPAQPTNVTQTRPSLTRPNQLPQQHPAQPNQNLQSILINSHLPTRTYTPQQLTSHIFQIRQKIEKVQVLLQELDHSLREETNVLNRVKLQKDREKYLEYFSSLQKERQHYEATQTSQQQAVQRQLQQHQLQRQQHQAQMQQQQMQQMANVHEQHQQQLRQQQLQQQRLAQSEEMFRLMNANGKRPAREILDASSRPKQARIGSNLPETSITEVNNESSDNMSAVRIPNGVTLSVLSQSESVSPPVPPGARTGSRHSSGTTSPAIQSPGSVTTRLAQSGISLTIASPAPVPLSPPINPIHSPISDCSPSTSPQIPTTSVIQRTPSASSPKTPSQHSPLMVNVLSNDSNFAIPRAPLSNRGPVGLNMNAERPHRPPTIDLTEDDIQNHNANMRATGGGVVTHEQIQNHNERRIAGIPGTNQYTLRPPVPTKPVACPHCNVSFGSIESMQEHRMKVHGQGQQQQFANLPRPAQPYFRQPNVPQGPQVAVRRSSPVAQNPANVIAHHQADPPARSNIPQRIAPAPIVPRTANPVSRAHEVTQGGSGERENHVIPLLNLAKLDAAKLRALNEMGVASFIPLQGIQRLGIPIMRLPPNVAIGHFPHDSAIEIGPIHHIPGAEVERVSPSASVTASNNSGPVAVVSPPVSTNGGHGHRNGSNFDPMMLARRPSPVVHHSNSNSRHGNLPGSLGGNNHTDVPPHDPNYHGNCTLPYPHHHPHVFPPDPPHHQQQQRGAHDSYVGTHSQLIVTPINRN